MPQPKNQPIKTAEEIRAADAARQKRFYDRRKEAAKLYGKFPILEGDFILQISERVVENGQPKRIVRLALLLQWARETGIIR